MPWDGAFPIGRGRGGRGPRAGLPGARPLAASRAPRSAPAPGRGARRAGRGRGPRRGGPAWEGAGGRACGCARARACHRVCESECVCLCVCARECARAAGAGVSLRAGARATRARACGRMVQRAAGGGGERGKGRGAALPRALQQHTGIPQHTARTGMRGALMLRPPLHLLSPPPKAVLQPLETNDPGVASKEASGEVTPWVSKHALGQKSTPGAAKQDERMGKGQEKGDHSSAKVTSERHSPSTPGGAPGCLSWVAPPHPCPSPFLSHTRPGTQLSGAPCWTTS